MKDRSDDPSHHERMLLPQSSVTKLEFYLFSDTDGAQRLTTHFDWLLLILVMVAVLLAISIPLIWVIYRKYVNSTIRFLAYEYIHTKTCTHTNTHAHQKKLEHKMYMPNIHF